MEWSKLQVLESGCPASIVNLCELQKMTWSLCTLVPLPVNRGNNYANVKRV